MTLVLGFSMARAAEPTPAAPENSVLKTAENTTVTSNVVNAPEATVTTSDQTVAATPCQRVCRRCRVYNVEETCNETCRNRLFGGYVKKQTFRQVYKPVR